MEKTDIIQLTMAYIGCFFFTAWGIWSIKLYGIAFADLEGFVVWCVTFGTVWLKVLIKT